MTSPAAEGSGSEIAPSLIAWGGLGAAAGFLLWSLRVEPAGVDAVDASLRLYVSSLLIGLLLSGAVLVCLRGLRVASASLGVVSYASCVVYLGCGKALGWVVLPTSLAAAVAVSALVFGARRRVAADSALLLAHAMGTLSGLYLFFHLREFLSALPAFRDVLQAMWMLLAIRVRGRP